MWTNLWYSERWWPLGPKYVKAYGTITTDNSYTFMIMIITTKLPVDVWVVDSCSEGKFWWLKGVIWGGESISKWKALSHQNAPFLTILPVGKWMLRKKTPPSNGESEGPGGKFSMILKKSAFKENIVSIFKENLWAYQGLWLASGTDRRLRALRCTGWEGHYWCPSVLCWFFSRPWSANIKPTRNGSLSFEDAKTLDISALICGNKSFMILRCSTASIFNVV